MMEDDDGSGHGNVVGDEDYKESGEDVVADNI